MEQQQLGRYTILQQIAAGGMGVVYKGRDERLKRDVAVKVLPTGILDEQTRQRFRAEALTLSKLNHPSICVIHDFDTQENTDFLVMELVTGGTLADRIDGNPIPEREIITLGAQVAEALDEAHGQGVIHRDLKPGNIMLTAKGLAKVLDFGLAKWYQTTGDDLTAAMTESRTLAGTLPYMAPEQTRGETTDARSDTYALGVTLYEMATGRRPFTDTNPLQLTDAIVNRAPVPPRSLTPDVSEGMENIILKCLEKNPDQRYQSAKEIAVDLRRLTGSSTGVLSSSTLSPGPGKSNRWPVVVAGAAAFLAAVSWPYIQGLFNDKPVDTLVVDTAEAKTLVVLPFENLGSPDDQYFADGITEEITSRLAEISGLKVVSRTSAVRLAGSGKTLKEIGAELGVGTVLEGTIRTDRSPDGSGSVRVTPQLIRVADDSHLWTERYTVNLVPGEIFEVQAEIAEHVAEALNVTLLELERDAIKARPTESLDAYEAYLLGRFYWNKRQAEPIRRAMEYFQQAIAADSAFALGYVGLADAYGIAPSYQIDDLSEGEFSLRSEAAARRAIALDNTLAEAHASLASALGGRLAFEESDREFELALQMDPDYAVTHYWYAETLMARGLLQKALAHTNMAAELEPASPIVHHLRAFALMLLERDNESVDAAKRALALEPGFHLPHSTLGAIYLKQGRFDEAEEEFRQFGFPPPVVSVVMEYSRGAIDTRTAEERLGELLMGPGPGPPSPLATATVFAWIDAKNRALDFLEQAYRQYPPSLWVLRIIPGFRSLDGDPRFEDLLLRLGLKQPGE